jgi:hypothetical protein
LGGLERIIDPDLKIIMGHTWNQIREISEEPKKRKHAEGLKAAK